LGRRGPAASGNVGIVHELDHLFTLRTGPLRLAGAVLIAYALLDRLPAFAKRLFGLRSGGRAEERERQSGMSWAAIERAAPPGTGARR
jgi:hypothetical protein